MSCLTRLILSFTLVAAGMVCAGCQALSLSRVVNPPQPLFVAGNDPEVAWERVVDVLHDYPFEIARENKENGIIETEYKTGGNLLEPWHRDSVGFRNRLESGLQAIRRKVFVTLTPTDGGFVITVRADKEIQNIDVPTINTAGGSTFQENQPLRRDLDAVLDKAPEATWTTRGRDFELEHDLSVRLRNAFGR